MVKYDKILKIEVTTLDGNLIIKADNQFSFPKMYVGDRMINNLLMIKGKQFPEVDKGSMVYVITYMKSGERVKYLSQVNMSSEFQFNVLLKEDRSQIMEERRRFYKIKAHADCAVSFVTRQDKIMRFEEPAGMIIQDINIGGVFLLPHDKVQFLKDDILMLVLPLQDDKLELLAQILRVQYDTVGELQGYGCKFLNTTSKQEETIAKFIYLTQLERRKQEIAKKQEQT